MYSPIRRHIKNNWKHKRFRHRVSAQIKFPDTQDSPCWIIPDTRGNGGLRFCSVLSNGSRQKEQKDKGPSTFKVNTGENFREMVGEHVLGFPSAQIPSWESEKNLPSAIFDRHSRNFRNLVHWVAGTWCQWHVQSCYLCDIEMRIKQTNQEE